MKPGIWDLMLPDHKYKMHILHLAVGQLHPSDGSKCRIKIFDISSNEKTVGIDNEINLIVGEGETELERFLEKCMAKMTVGSKCRVYTDDDSDEDGLFSAELVSFEKPTPFYRMNNEEKIQEAIRIKEKATNLIQKYRERDAFHLLKRALRAICFASDKADKAFEVYLAIVGNMSLCSLKMRDHDRTLALCNKVINEKPDHVKCLLRRAAAFDAVEEAEKAKQDIEAVLKGFQLSKEEQRKNKKKTFMQRKRVNEALDKMASKSEGSSADEDPSLQTKQGAFKKISVTRLEEEGSKDLSESGSKRIRRTPSSSSEKTTKKIRTDASPSGEPEGNSSAVNRKLQVFIRPVEEGVKLSSSQAEEIRKGLITEMKELYKRPDWESTKALHFQNSGLVDPGWYLITCQDESTLQWMLDWKPVLEGCPLKVVESTEAGRPVQIGFWYKVKEVDLDHLIAMLRGQNKGIRPDKWKHVSTTEDYGGWFLVFMVEDKEVLRLREVDWTLHFELDKLEIILLTGHGVEQNQDHPEDWCPTPTV